MTKLGATKLEPTDNAELLAIEREIDRLGAIEAEIEEKRIKPRENLWVGAMREPVGPRRRFKTSDEDLPGTRGRDPCRSMRPQREGID